MADLRYAVILEPDEDALQVIVPAFPEIHTFGDSVAQALEMARDAIELSLAYRHDKGLDIPPPDAGVARLESVAVPAPAA
jgi:predicted RNase H-like HicB family nuclease